METHPERGQGVVVIGAGPIGLAAAAHLVSRGETPMILEAGDRVGASIALWSHVRLFSPWKYLVDPNARAMLEAIGWRMPDPERIPTGGELVEQYLEPLAMHPAMEPLIRLQTRVIAVSRSGMDKVKSANRATTPFEVVARVADGGTVRVLARAVVDASGTYEQPNPLGANGLPLEGERELAGAIRYGIPDVMHGERTRYAGRRVLVVGSGHSAFNALLDLARLAEVETGTEVIWAIRRPDVGQLFGGGARDALPQRGNLGTRLRRLVERGAVRLVTDFRAARVDRAGDGIVVTGDGGKLIGPIDEIVVATGFRPDLNITRELRLGLDAWLESPAKLAPLIDPNEHSCGTVYPHGAEELAHPEPDFYTVGMKSYGRAPTFLLLTGYEQVRSVACRLTGDEEGARSVQLVLPETGVCSTDRPASDCCGAGEPASAAPLAGSCGISAGCTSEPSPAAEPATVGCC